MLSSLAMYGLNASRGPFALRIQEAALMSQVPTMDTAHRLITITTTVSVEGSRCPHTFFQQ